jgi:hypothetical protein
MTEQQTKCLDIEADEPTAPQSKAPSEPVDILTRMRALKDRISPATPLRLVQSVADGVSDHHGQSQTGPEPDGNKLQTDTKQPKQRSTHDISLAFEQKRKAFRNRCLRSGKVVFHQRRYYVDCQVRDESAQGMKLRIMGTVDVPDTFELLIESREALIPVEVRWRNNREIGVEICGDPVPLPRRMIMDTSRRRLDI